MTAVMVTATVTGARARRVRARRAAAALAGIFFDRALNSFWEFKNQGVGAARARSHLTK